MIIGPVIAAYIGDIIPRKKTGLGMSLYQTTVTLDRTIGTMTGGLIVNMYGFNLLFILGSISSFFSLIMSYFFIHDDKHSINEK